VYFLAHHNIFYNQGGCGRQGDGIYEILRGAGNNEDLPRKRLYGTTG
jgi:hypothetical protein